MADIVEKIKKFFVPGEDDEDEFGYNESPRQERPQPQRAERERDIDMSGSYSSAGSYSSSRASTRSERAERAEQDDMKRGGNVVNIHATAQLQVVLVKPEVFSDAKEIADHLIAKKTVVLNLESASAEAKRRIIDFLVGVAYAKGGSLKRVANMTYIITPYNVGFVGEELVGELENNGVII